MNSYRLNIMIVGDSRCTNWPQNEFHITTSKVSLNTPNSSFLEG